MTSRRSRTHPSRCLDGERQLASARLNLYRENLAFREHWPRCFDARGRELSTAWRRGNRLIAHLRFRSVAIWPEKGLLYIGQ